MNKFLTNLFIVCSIALTFSSCRKKAYDDFYGRPENLAPPIYQVLQSKGNFSNLLACIDKSGYKATLNAAGYWTFFAPNDEAFKKYFTENNTSIDRMDSVTARKIVTYCLVYNSFKTDHIADYQANTGWVINNAFKRRTAYYDGVYQDAANGQQMSIISSNRNPYLTGNTANVSYIFGDNNNKYIPYFFDSYITTKGLSAADYNYFFPNATYSGFNVVDASVVNKDITAENGTIHEINRVVLPLPSLEQYLASNPQYSAFKKLYDQFMITYQANADATHRNTVLTGSGATVYVKQYSNLLGFSPNNENFLKVMDNDGQSDGYSLFVPSNDVFNKYLNDVILENYKTVDKLPTQIIADLLNAHMWQTTVWPSKFSTTNNIQGEPARFSATGNVVDKKFCSNGVFYGTNIVQQANVFSSVYGKAYLDPNYSLMTRALDLNLRYTVSSPNLKFTVFMMPDAVLRSLGYDYSTANSAFTYTSNGVTTVGNTARDQLLRILNLHIVLTPSGELNDLSGSGIAETYGGEYIRWKGNTVYAGGNVENNQVIGVTGSKTANNGKVYYLNNNVLQYPVNTVASQIQKNAAKSSDPYYDFYQYLINSTVYSATTGEITAIQPGVFYTIFIPTHQAILDAVKNGWLPGTVSGSIVTPNYNPSSSTDKDMVSRFILFHILDGNTVAPDGKKNGQFATLLKNSVGDKVNLVIASQLNSMQIGDNKGRTANLVPANSNYLATRTLLHQIDTYLQYAY
ncbi:hypothetical protein HH214_04850 [Mucilaginibacter robiniae]|uniref:FAS1 domain-containing protein n=1 Tax=Mucilaginibacter robiniae TaxID=2728022 RepID=A0A7L5DWW8_9SPHI|nr:fasciclin domain-containing protein [Mucilaginibacter robiniae]QJD95251.1 hypothetical protein HH214_04850 [Mucilaginibacter robiniae]